MVKAHSLLYAIYVCLLVSILCGALLYFANLYNMLNQYYNLHEDLYIQNQSALNYALSNGNTTQELLIPETGLTSSFEIKSHGLLSVAIVKSSLKGDTISSAHFIGHYPDTKMAIYLPSFSNPLTYSGNVKLIGDKRLPIKLIDGKNINNSVNKLTSSGITELSESVLPEINPDFKSVAEAKAKKLVRLKDIERSNDSVYFNSFLNKTIEIELTTSSIANVVIKGNFILYAKDSLTIKRDAVLQDVILKSPKIKIEEGFKGNLQVFASKKIEIGSNVNLCYPSVLLIYNNSLEKSEIKVNENTIINGAVVIFGSPLTSIDDNVVIVKEKSLVIGDIYCSGKLMTNGKIYGSVYTNRFFSKINLASYENCIINAEIDVSKRPDYFVSIPLFKNQKEAYGVFKKVL